ncbi:Cyclin-K [Pseudolycoriella hygida]|uniref:Cyclin-K n=1 Tax=Pseudolycoriella hygida TaxID=35572 RepID=A0A9Q0S9U8_9DIPT|nr:Cyclin-K [Pseudolycoriella hygida]
MNNEIQKASSDCTMPNWYYEKKDLKNTPSIRDGLDYETERRYRKEGARFIMDCGMSMDLGHNTMATGVVYFHRFYMFQSFRQFPRYVTACCCLFLAGKVEETPKKCRDIIRTARTLLSEQAFMSFGDDPKEEVMTLERILLQTIKFDLQVEHPHNFLMKYVKCLKGERVKQQKIVQMAWNFVNDSLTTTVCLQWEPEIIAVALIHLASKLSKFSVSKWVLDLYQPTNTSTTNTESPPQLPPSKYSPPPKPKRAKMSPTFKSSPIPNVAKPTIDEKLESMPVPKSMTTDNANYANYPPAYGTMFTEFTSHFPQPPPNSQPLPPYPTHPPPVHVPPPHVPPPPSVPPLQHYHPPPNPPAYYPQPPPMHRGVLTLTDDSGMLWHSGMISDVRLAAMMPAI